MQVSLLDGKATLPTAPVTKAFSFYENMLKLWSELALASQSESTSVPENAACTRCKPPHILCGKYWQILQWTGNSLKPGLIIRLEGGQAHTANPSRTTNITSALFLEIAIGVILQDHKREVSSLVNYHCQVVGSDLSFVEYRLVFLIAQSGPAAAAQSESLTGKFSSRLVSTASCTTAKLDHQPGAHRWKT